MKDQLIALGWVMYYECVTPCAKQYYNNAAFPGYEIRIRTRKNTFLVVSENNIIGGPFYAYQLEEKLKKFNIYES